MKRILLLFMFICICMTKATSQNYQDVLYLKNGSVIRGIVIEQVPNESLKIQTSDGSIFVYKMTEVLKITKEVNSYQYSNNLNYSNSPQDETEIYKYLAGGKKKTGYCGFLDVGYNFGVGDYKEGRVELLTSHGYRPVEFFYIGLGVGVDYWFDSKLVSIPIFANIRGDIPTGTIVSPFLDVKFGYSPYDINGLYGNFSIGCSFATSANGGVYISFGYQMQRADYKGFLYVPGYGSYNVKDKITVGGLSLKIGVEF